MCTTLEVSRSGYYDWRRRHESVRSTANEALLVRIAAVHAASRGTYGSPRVTLELKEQGTRVGRHRVARLMRQVGLKGRQRRPFRIRTTDSNHDQPIAPNRMAAIAPPSCTNRVWVSDITYIQTDQGWLYLAGVLDRYSRRLVGWAMAETPDAALPVAALKMALARRQPGPGLLHHSDRGVQYASDAYRALLAANAITSSMSRKGNCYDNAYIESFWSTLKNELTYRRHFATRAQAKTEIFNYIETFYNRIRRHSALGYKSPLAYETTVS
jgi:putative transposase